MGATRAKTESEALFEEYLNRNSYVPFEYEPTIPGQGTTPDYRIPWQGNPTHHEVKEMYQKRPRPPGGGFYNPCKSLRKLIEKARTKFRSLKDSPCTLVVANIGDWTARLDPLNVFGSMLGDLGIKFTFDPEAGVCVENSATPAFLEHGKMIMPKSGMICNQTISAIVVLKESRFFEVNFARDLRRLLLDAKWKKGRPLALEEAFDLRQHFYTRYPRARFSVPRTVVIENPVARMPMPRSLFRGPFDERWMIDENGMACVYKGVLLKEQRKIEHGWPPVTEAAREAVKIGGRGHAPPRARAPRAASGRGGRRNR